MIQLTHSLAEVEVLLIENGRDNVDVELNKADGDDSSDTNEDFKDVEIYLSFSLPNMMWSDEGRFICLAETTYCY